MHRGPKHNGDICANSSTLFARRVRNPLPNRPYYTPPVSSNCVSSGPRFPQPKMRRKRKRSGEADFNDGGGGRSEDGFLDSGAEDRNFS